MKRARPPMRRQASGHAHAASFGRQRLDTSLQVHFPVVQLLDPSRRFGRPVIAKLVDLPLERRALTVVTEQFQGPDALSRWGWGGRFGGGRGNLPGQSII